MNTNPSCYREELPLIPKRLLSRPVSRGFPVPWFVALIRGDWDFRVIDARKLKPAIEKGLCWICGDRLGKYLAFTIGPMCAINRVISEPPSHRKCAEFSIKACPFLNQQQIRRRDSGLPDDVQDAAGIAIKRQPGAVLLWITKSYIPFNAPGGGILFKIGAPIETVWYREGRAATRAEVLESIESGLPILREAAKQDGNITVGQLESQITKAFSLIPPEMPEPRKRFGIAARASPQG